MPFDTLIAAETAPAGGAATTQVIVMVAALTVGFTGLAIVGEAHRRGRRTPLGMLAAFSERVSGLPAWAAIPLAICAVALPGALFGYMWDASLHIGSGRDDGPFANPSHYFILAGLYGIIAAGYLASVLPRHGETPGRSAIKVAPDRYVPLGGALIAASGLFAFMGFPLDDVWHRLFGQDVTLWGPTHLIMLGGGMLTLIGVALLFEEGVASAPGRPERFHAKTDGRKRTSLARLADLAPEPAGEADPRADRRRLPRRAQHLPGGVRLRRAAVRAGPAAADDRRLGRDRAGRRADLARGRRRAGRGRLLPRDPRDRRRGRRPDPGGDDAVGAALRARGDLRRARRARPDQAAAR